MGLPANGEYWPPRTWSNILDFYARWDAWYTDDTDALQWLYATTRVQTHTSMWAQVRRFFVGSPTPQTTMQRPVKVHVPVASGIARLGSQIMFSEMPAIQFGDGDRDTDDKGLPAGAAKTATSRLTELLNDEAHAALLEGAEYRTAHGGVFHKVAWNREIVPEGPYIDTVAADAAIPTFQSGRLASVIFWSDLTPISGDDHRYKLLEEHTPGRIEYGLYAASNPKQLGTRVPLTDHPDTAYLASQMDAESGIPTGSKLLTAVYVPNSRPNGMLRKDPIGRDLGKSAFDGSEYLLDQLDETYTSWMRDIRLGRARLMVSKNVLDVGTPGQGTTFDSDREFFVQLGEAVGSLNPGGTGTGAHGSVQGFMEMYQPNIRFQEHMQTAVHLLAKTYQACGFSPQTFGDAGEVAVTATEVTARQSLTSLTRSAGVMYYKPQLRRLFACLLDVDKFVFGGPGRGEAFPDIEFPDAETIAPEVQARTLQLLTQAEAVSLETKVKMLHDDWEQDQVDAEVTKIKGDLSLLPDPTMAHLWAAQSDNGSLTGGVPFSAQDGSQVDPAVVKQATKAAQAVNAQEKAADRGTGNPN